MPIPVRTRTDSISTRRTLEDKNDLCSKELLLASYVTKFLKENQARSCCTFKNWKMLTCKGDVLKRWLASSESWSILKKGNQHDYANYKYFSLLNIAYKILSSIITDRLKTHIERLHLTRSSHYSRKSSKHVSFQVGYNHLSSILIKQTTLH